MIRRTFQLLPSLGPWRERDLWARGVTSWDEFPATGVVMSPKLDGPARERIAEARAALAGRDLVRLARLIPAREHWRLYGEFSNEAVFFDIEMDGREHQRPTVVSLFDRDGLHVFIQDRNLDALPDALRRRPIWVTFNGAVYDVPILRRYFGTLPEPPVHLDLKTVCRRMRLTGGLKHIEDLLGLARPAHLRGTNGMDAVLLWRAYRRRADLEALRFLVEYNLYDSFQLRSILDLAFNRIPRELGHEEPQRPVFDRGDILYDVSRLLAAIGHTQSDASVLDRVRARDYQLEQGPVRPRYVL
jgi:uncharacterized protein YprB with RNaseH-like and TPR domain